MGEYFLTDTHCHIHMEPLINEVDGVITRAKASNINRMITIGIDTADSQGAVALANRYPQVYAAVGVHPHDVESFNHAQLAQFDKFISEPKVIAIGEVGLDYYRNLAPQNVQIDVFNTMIDIALAAELPLIIHTRDAAADTVKILDNMLCGAYADHRVLFHCFSGAIELIKWGISRQNVCFSFAGNVTYPKAVEIQDALRALPLERIFIETDCPYLAPVPKRGKQNEPSYLPYTAEFVSQAKNISVEELAKRLESNFYDFFRI